MERMVKRKVIIFGSGSFAEIVHFYLTHDSEYEVAAFTVHGSRLGKRELLGLPVMAFEGLADEFPPTSYDMFVAVGYSKVNQTRAAIYEEVKHRGYHLITYVSSKCTHWGDTKLGDNCFIFEDNTIQPFVTIGNDVVLWSGNHIGHHVTIHDHCFVSSHVVISGHVEVGRYSFLGVNATLRDSIRIGESCVIGSGALIMKSTSDGSVYASQSTKPRKVKSHQINI